MSGHRGAILKSIIDDLMKMPKGLGGKSAGGHPSKSVKIEIMGGHENPLEGSKEEEAMESPLEEDHELHEPEMDYDDEGPMGGIMRDGMMSSSPSQSKPSFGKGRGRR